MQLIFSLFFILVSSSTLFGQLSDTYTIGPGGDYATFNAAVTALETDGVSGPVIFNVQDGIYEEQLEINSISGVSETNTITFQSESGDSTAVTLKYEASSNDDNFIVKFNGSSYITFKHIKFKTAESTYGRVIYFENFTQYIEFLNCYFIGIYHPDNSANYQLIVCNNVNVDYLLFDKCQIDSSGAGISLASGDSENLVMGIQISNCNMKNVGYAAINLNHTYMPQIYNNTILANSIGIKTSSAHGPTVIRKNRINCNSAGMDINLLGYGGNEALVVNNFIISHNQNGINATGHFINFYNNSIYSTSANKTGSAFYFSGIQNPNTVVIVNNNICRMNAGKALHIVDGSYISECRNNNLYTSGNFIAYWDSVKCIDLAELELKSEMYMHSVSVYPSYLSSEDLHTSAPWLNGKGFPLSEVTDDIDGEARDAEHPDIGADEYDPGMIPALTGSYTIGNGGDYSTIQEAVEDAVFKGVEAAVIFNVLPGLYNEQLDIYSIPGANSNNRVTFRSSTGDTADVKITFSDAVYDSNYVISNFGADFISYENLTLETTNSSSSRILDLYRGSDSIEVRNCHFIGPNVSGEQSIFSGDSYHRSRIIEGNLFTGNNYAVHMRRGDPNDEYVHGTQVINNTINQSSYGGIRVEWQYAPVVTQNEINVQSYGIEIRNIEGPFEISKNRIETTSGGTGILASSAEASELQKGLIVNNTVSSISTAGESVGISIGVCDYCDIVYNSVCLLSTNFQSRAIEFTTSSAQNITIQNNNFSCINNGYVMQVYNDGAIANADYNNLYTPANFIALWNGQKIHDLYDLKDISGMNLNSQNVYPHYASELDLTPASPWLDGKGTPVSSVDEDINGNIRDVSDPDIGAVEFSADPLTMMPLNGVYTIGSGGDYTSIQSAFNDAQIKGISGPVDFLVLPGTYSEQIDILSIPGSNPSNMITLQSQSGDTSDTEITYSSSSADENFVLRFYGADFINIENLKVSALGEDYATVINFYLGCDSISFKGNSLKSDFASGANANKMILNSPDSYYTYRLIENNYLIDCAYGIYMRREASNRAFPINLKITNNKIVNCGYYGNYIQFHDAPEIDGNQINAGFIGIMASTCDNAVRITNNQISATYDYGIQLSGCTATSDEPGLIANNFIYVGGSTGSGTSGIQLSATDYYIIAHNSVNFTNTHLTSGRAFYQTSGSNLDIMNNIFVNSGGGYAYYVGTPSAVVQSDYNDLYATGTNLAYWNGNRTDLAALQAESGMDVHSLSVNPGFTSNTDLHINSEDLDGAGTPITEVPIDIDGQSRHPETPDIGADEYRTGPNNPPYVSSAIPDQEFDEDSGPHIIADLQTVFSDDDLDDYLTFEVMDYPGVLATKANDTLTINTAANYYGIGMIYVTATDLGGLSSVDSFLVTVNPVPDAPVAVDDEITTLTNTMAEVYPLENDTDVDSDELTIIRVTDPPNGTATILPGDTSISYVPDLNFFGADSFRYVVQDETTLEDSAWVFLTITNIFSEVETPFAQLSNSVVLAGDYDDDKDLDVFICGTEDGTHNVSQLYRNTGGVFSATQSFLGLMPDNPQGAAWNDFDNDGDLDLIISGIVDNSPFTVSTVLYQNGGGFFTQLATDLNDIWNGSITWADIDNDGDQDLLMMGNQTYETYNPLTKLWRNDGENGASGWVFTDITGDQFPDLCGSSAAWADYDKDGDLDVAIMGMEGLNSPFFDIYKNEEGSFTALGLELTQIGYGQLMWGDYDSDGDPDLLFSGETSGLLMRNGIIRNDRSDTFAELHPFESRIGLGSSWWVDYDSDGDLDAFFTGEDSLFARQSAAYANTEGSFESAEVSLPAISHGSMGWGDYNEDGRIDVVITGMGASSSRKSVLMQNNHPNSNMAPAAPTIYSTSCNENSITLNWHRPSDDHTASRALTYNVRVGVTSEDVSIASPMSHLDDGFRKIVTIGHVTQDTSWSISGLTSGRLYIFSVQAVDAAYKGSTFDSTYIAPLNDYFMERYHQIPGFMQGDAETADFEGDKDYDLLITGMTYEDEHVTNLIQGQGLLYAPIENDLPGSSDGALEWKDFDGDADPDLLICGLDPSGVHDYMNDIYLFEDGNYTLMDPGIDGIMRGDTKWFDYDNDGDLDIISTGTYGSIPITKLFENQGGGYIETDDEFIGTQYSSIDIADYDTDGDMDILITGAINDPPYRLTAIYRNEGDGFIEISEPFKPVSHGDAKWGDYDMDGDMDILLTGEVAAGVTQGGYAGIYRNVNGQWFETPDTSVLIDVRNSTAAWGDLDNDGDLDCMISGLIYIDDIWQPKAQLYLNEDNVFVLVNDVYLADHYDGDIIFAKLNSDENLDIFQCGVNKNNDPESKMFFNRIQIENTTPSTPSNLNAVINDSIITFSWDTATDAQTDADGLSYNIRIGSQPLHSDIKMCQADTSGFRIVQEYGNIGSVTEWKMNISNLEGGLYWSVQSVDNCFAGSPFATEQYINLTDILEKKDFLPKKFALYQNYPNPFNPSTKIRFDVPVTANVEMVLYNILGEKVQTLVNSKYDPGRHEYVLDASRLAAGVYFYRIKTDQFMNTKRMILIK